ncbi:pentapeptide repeat-containing protein [Amycolatopsis sp. CA-128772]|uniref:pentapeptide repeat-containing protein n=1 Tax=Amycolatopsis sp. CA-128772 TaxID=2073159 RepID=UPI000CD307F3|nr:pentapeptide repeat-containing protein [Amycolatopsis sp. CA-128772]
MTAAAVAAVTGVLLWVFLAWSGRPDAPVRIDAVKTAFGVGAGGAFALWLATRRQRTLELQLAETTLDLEERRVTELYTKSVEQLGSDKAPVRLGGLYALERLGQDNPKHRQSIVNVLCAYLRMPFKAPDTGLRGRTGAEPGEDTDPELLVRLAAQFTGTANFDRSTFDEGAFFSGSHFARDARFTRIRSGGVFQFSHTTFDEGAAFEDGEHEELDLADARFPEAG